MTDKNINSTAFRWSHLLGFILGNVGSTQRTIIYFGFIAALPPNNSRVPSCETR